MKKNIFFTFVFILCFFNTGISGTTAIHAKLQNVDRSTPEKTIALFVKAFKEGKDELLTLSATSDSLPEFNPIQKIQCPTNSLLGYRIERSKKTGNNETELHVQLLFNKPKSENNPSCNRPNMLWEFGVYRLKKINRSWLIVNCLPFWPEAFPRN